MIICHYIIDCSSLQYYIQFSIHNWDTVSEACAAVTVLFHEVLEQPACESILTA